MVNEEKLHEIAKPRNEKEFRKFVLRYKFRGIITIWQNLQLLWYKYIKK